MSGRDNGLSADSYKPLVDLHPRLADAMLDALAESGVAAYAAPAVRPFVADLYAPVLRGPVDRLWVDADAEPAARTVLERALPALRAEMEGQRSSGDRGSGQGRGTPAAASASGEPPESVEPPRPAESRPAESRPTESNPATTEASGPDVSGPSTNGPVAPGGESSSSGGLLDEDAIWAQLIARFNESPSHAVPTWPVAEDLPESDGDAGRTAGNAPPERAGGPGAAGPPTTSFPLEIPVWRGPVPTSSGKEEHDDHFVPPPPPPLPQLDTMGKLAWVGLAGGPLYFLLSVLLGWEAGGWSAIGAGLAFITGFVALVSRLRANSEGEDEDDDGAVV